MRTINTKAHPGKLSLVQFVTCLFLSAVVLMHLGLVGLGQWLGDEYDDFGRLNREGWAFLGRRLKWSPRPFSESLFCVYGWIVNHSHRAFIATFLGFLWLMLIAAAFATFWQDQRERSNQEVWPTLLIPLTLLSLFVASAGRIIWVFYWPAAAVAYLPTLAASLLLFVQAATGRLSSHRGREVGSICLFLAACSSEAGAIFVVCYGTLQAIGLVAAILRRRFDIRESPPLWWLAPAVVATSILLVVGFNRFHAQEWPRIPFGSSKQHFALSLLAGVRQLWAEVLGSQLPATGHPGSALVAKILLAGAAALAWSCRGRIAKRVAAQILSVIAALMAASMGTLVSAYFHFGFLCCDQHSMLRQCWILISFAGFGMVFSPMVQRVRRLPRAVNSGLAQILLCIAVLSAWHVRPVLRTYRLYGQIRGATVRNFQAGFQSGDEMMFVPLPDSLIAHLHMEPGLHVQSSEEAPEVQYMLRFFRKQKLIVASPQ
jgi:hypothetical protein